MPASESKQRAVPVLKRGARLDSPGSPRSLTAGRVGQRDNTGERAQVGDDVDQDEEQHGRIATGLLLPRLATKPTRI